VSTATPIGLWQTVALTYLAFALAHGYSYWRGKFLLSAPT
jgi:hypothetical protein